MQVVIDSILAVVDWRFAAGLAVGCLLTLRYVVIGIYHPIIRDQMEQNATRRRDDKPD